MDLESRPRDVFDMSMLLVIIALAQAGVENPEAAAKAVLYRNMK